MAVLKNVQYIIHKNNILKMDVSYTIAVNCTCEQFIMKPFHVILKQMKQEIQ